MSDIMEREIMNIKSYRKFTGILALIMSVIFMAGCSVDDLLPDIDEIINEAVNEVIDNTVENIQNIGNGDNTTSGPGDEHWGNSNTSGNGTGSSGNTSSGPGDEHWGTPTPEGNNDSGSGSSGSSGIGDIIDNLIGGGTVVDSGDNPEIDLPKPQPGVTVLTLEEDLAGDTYGLLYPKQREAYVGRNYYYHITDEKSFVIAVHDGLYRGIRGIVLQYDFGNYNYWKDTFDRIINRSEFGGFVKDSFLVEPEENSTIGIYPVFNVAWDALNYYRYKEPEIGEEAMKVLKAAHELAEDAMKACPGDERGILLYINNKICNITSYPDVIPRGLGVAERDATGAFIKGSTVCAGYAVAYRLVLEILGIENTMLVNNKEAEDPAYHIWNYVKYNNEWRHVDVTWNDSDSEYFRNRYFLLTDEELKEKTAGASDAFAHEWVELYTY